MKDLTDFITMVVFPLVSIILFGGMLILVYFVIEEVFKTITRKSKEQIK